MKPKLTDQALSQLLSQRNHILDDGFTNRVIASLPPARESYWLRSVVMLSAVLLAGIISVVVFPQGELIIRSLHDFAAWQSWASLRQFPLVSLAVLASLTAPPLLLLLDS